MKSASLGLLTAALLTTLPATAESSASLAWHSCGTPSGLASGVAARTECARLTVPRDHFHPQGDTIDLDVVRVRANGERGARHDGSVLLEPDEFGDAVDRSVAAVASSWLEGGDAWRDAAGRLDLIGLSPRRMEAGGHDCLSATSRLPRHASLGTDATKANLTTAEGLARAIATACQNDAMHAHIGMRPRVEDIEHLREALGQPRLHLLGTGRGGWVAARYAERYPANVGRMLLDGTWDVDGSVVEAMEARVEERGRTLRRAISALTSAPERYGWGGDESEIHARIAMLPPSVWSAWSHGVDGVDELSAVLAMGRVMERDPSMAAHDLRRALTTVRLATGGEDDRAARRAAGLLLDRLEAGHVNDAYGFGPRAGTAEPARIASAFAARCNDGFWGTGRTYWRERTRQLREAWPSSVGNETFQGMVCNEWPGAFGSTSVPMLDGVPAFLMVHAEFDGEAPLRNAAMALNAHDNAKMVVARGLRAHGVALRHDWPCVSTAAARFLADGVLPDAKLTNCRASIPPQGL